MPLLIDTFIEVAPSKREHKNSSEISLQTASILKCILNIILLLWKIFQNSDNPSELVCKLYIINLNFSVFFFCVLYNLNLMCVLLILMMSFNFQMRSFSENYGVKICQTFLSSGFPYVTLNSGGGVLNKNKKQKNDTDVVLDLFGDSMIQSDTKCSKQNMDLCLIYLLLSKYKKLPISAKIISVYLNGTF